MYEIIRLHFTNRADKEAYLQYRLEVKNRLNVQYKVSGGKEGAERPGCLNRKCEAEEGRWEDERGGV